MKNFICGIMFAGGIALFGKSMYELGKLREQRENAKIFTIIFGTCGKQNEEKTES